jgi:hypothetical protein
MDAVDTLLVRGRGRVVDMVSNDRGHAAEVDAAKFLVRGQWLLPWPKHRHVRQSSSSNSLKDATWASASLAYMPVY